MKIAVNLNERVKVKLTAFGEAVLANHRVREFEKLGGSFNPHDKMKLPENATRYLFYENEPDENGYRAFQLHELFHIFGQVVMFPAQQIEPGRGEHALSGETDRDVPGRGGRCEPSIEAAMDAIGRNYADDAAIETYKTEIFQALELKTRGLGEKAQQAAMQTMEDRIGAARLSRMIDDDPIAAQKWFAENKDRFSAAAQVKAKDVLEKEVGKKVVRNGADAIWERFKDNEESAREAIYADENFTDEQKDMIWQRYQARATDNRRFEAQAEAEWYNKRTNTPKGNGSRPKPRFGTIPP